MGWDEKVRRGSKVGGEGEGLWVGGEGTGRDSLNLGHEVGERKRLDC
jgi:hypothetical protein